MKIAIIGAGAIGGYVGVKLALAGEDVTFMVRGANLEAIRQRGMVLEMEDGTVWWPTRSRPATTTTPSARRTW
jgi:2-dehydropantoate 2-reductase